MYAPLNPLRKVNLFSLEHFGEVQCFAQAFFASAKVQGVFQPLPSPPLQLTQLDQCRIRDRSTIMARHLFADRGDVFADEQVRPAVVQQLPRLQQQCWSQLVCG